MSRQWRWPCHGETIRWTSLFFILFVQTSLAQSDIHVAYNSTGDRTHLRGIRRIPATVYASKPPPLAVIPDAPRAVAPPTSRHVSTPPSFPITTTTTKEERHDRFASLTHPRLAAYRGAYAEHVAATSGHSRQFAAPTAHAPRRQQPNYFSSSVEVERKRRIQARWRKIGPLVGTNGSRYQRMRLIQQKAWTHPPTSTTPTNTVPQIVSRHAPTPQTQQPDAVRPTLPQRSEVTAAQMAIRATQPTGEPQTKSELAAIANNNIRRQSLRTGSSLISPTVVSPQPGTWESLAVEKPSKPSRAFGERTQHFASASRISFPGRRITGPILTPLPEGSNQPAIPNFGQPRGLPFAEGTGNSANVRSQLPTALEETSDGPTIVGDFSSTGEDYHHRQAGMRAEHRFKLVTNRLVPRPRLKIRTHEEARAQAENTNNQAGPISLPELATFDQFPNPTGNPLPRRPVLPSSASVQSPKPVSRPRQVPRVTEWGDEDVEAIRGHRPPAASEFESTDGLSAGPPPGTNEETGDSAAGFGPIGTPPPGFNEAFGLNGASVPLDPNADLLAPAPPLPTEATTPQPTEKPEPATTAVPAPEAPLIIPENSGLRPAAPPKEFQGGFGSSRGSPFSSFPAGPGNGGIAAPDSESSAGHGAKNKKGKKGGKGRQPKKLSPEPELKEEDFFTGESALTPNVRGPTGDGYGPSVLPGQLIPPPVPAVSTGGEAAGIMPMSSFSAASMDVTENTPTTIKPSALLNILNRADLSFNQMLTNFESGAPLESAAIDILEVALGSQKLDSQAKLLGHVDRTIGLDNLQRLQRWANTGGALDEMKEQLVKLAKNFKPPPETKTITIPPQLEYLFQSSG
ncbi:hypothetical protein M3Y98_00074600 [Aphelenchoides besseyi]|nr:hypothetical protein M3Y98_00074600 [Aphelenchoides besseyi]KAI6198723.1 hypothetical protein M3Y96_00549700 [Aphelenchoides besseyi]